MTDDNFSRHTPEAVPAGATDAPPPAPAVDLPALLGLNRPRRTWDLVLTIVILCVSHGAIAYLDVAAFVAWVLGLLSCLDGCDLGAIYEALFLAVTVPAGPVGAAGIVAIVLLVRRRIAFWVPLLGLAGSIALLPWAFAGFAAL